MTIAFRDGILSIWDEADLKSAEIGIEASAVIQLHIGAKCYKALGFQTLLSRISIFRNTQLIRLADDYIHEHDMVPVMEALGKSFPSANVKWSHDLLVDGKHGR